MAKSKSSGIKNAPSTTGNKSGKGRGNNPPNTSKGTSSSKPKGK